MEPKDTTANAPVAESETNEAPLRRGFLIVGIAGLVSAFFKACNDRAGFVERWEGPDSPAREGVGSVGVSDVAVNNEQHSTITSTPKPQNLDAECPAVTTTKIDISGITISPPELAPVIKFYGSESATSLLAIKLKIATTTQIIICTTEGKNLALHVVNPADRSSDGSLRPIIIDGLHLRGLSKIKLMTTSDSGIYISEHNIDYFNTYKDLPVLNLGQQTFPENFPENQCIARFDNLSGFSQSNVWFYPNSAPSSPQRPLYTAQKAAKWMLNNSLKGDILDVMGESISDLDILENQTFCSYVLGTDKKYYRTMLKIG